MAIAVLFVIAKDWRQSSIYWLKVISYETATQRNTMQP